MVVFIDTKSGKIDITKEQLEKILKEAHDEGYEEGKKAGTITYSGCPYGYTYWCPYKSNTTSPIITWTSNSTSTTNTPTLKCGTITTGKTTGECTFSTSTD